MTAVLVLVTVRRRADLPTSTQVPSGSRPEMRCLLLRLAAEAVYEAVGRESTS